MKPKPKIQYLFAQPKGKKYNNNNNNMPVFVLQNCKMDKTQNGIAKSEFRKTICFPTFPSQLAKRTLKKEQSSFLFLFLKNGILTILGCRVFHLEIIFKRDY